MEQVEYIVAMFDSLKAFGTGRLGSHGSTCHEFTTPTTWRAASYVEMKGHPPCHAVKCCHLLKTICYFPLLVLKGFVHYCKYRFFFPTFLTKWNNAGVLKFRQVALFPSKRKIYSQRRENCNCCKSTGNYAGEVVVSSI